MTAERQLQIPPRNIQPWPTGLNDTQDNLGLWGHKTAHLAGANCSLRGDDGEGAEEEEGKYAHGWQLSVTWHIKVITLYDY